MGRPTKRNSNGTQEPTATSTSAKQIQWSGTRDNLLAYKLKKNWKEYERSKNKMSLCRKWAADLGIAELDPGGDKTKAHICYLVQGYTKAKELLKELGGGTITKEIRRGSRKETITLTLDDQIQQICP